MKDEEKEIRESSSINENQTNQWNNLIMYKKHFDLYISLSNIVNTYSIKTIYKIYSIYISGYLMLNFNIRMRLNDEMELYYVVVEPKL